MNFQNVPVKREVQHIMFTTVNKKGVKITGLAGNNSKEYKQMLKLHFSSSNITLVDLKEVGEGIINKPIGEVNPTSVMDCDFCSTIATSGEEFLKVYNKMSAIKGKKVLSFTFSLRLKGGLDRTLCWLNNYVYSNTLDLNKGNYTRSFSQLKYWKIIGHTQDKFDESILVMYKDSHTMLSGAISWY